MPSLKKELDGRSKRLNIRSFGLQQRLVRRTGICAPVMSIIFSGKRRPTPEQAAKLEEAFLHYEIDITRMDLLYNVKVGERLSEFMDRKFGRD